MMTQWNEAIGPIDGVMFDVDGTLILSDRQLGQYTPLPHAAETLARLREAGTPFLLLTNGSAYPGAEQAEKLRRIGLPVDDAQMLTPNTVAASLFRTRGVARVMVLGTDGVSRALAADGIATCAPGDDGAVDAVYIGWAPDCSMADIHAACGAVMAGAALYTASDVPFFATKSGPAFGYSCAIVGAITRVTGVEAEVTGKPSLHAMTHIAGQLGMDAARIAVIGDDPRVETEMARAGGAIGIGVTTGTTSTEQWAAQELCRRPHRVITALDALWRDDLLGQR